MSKVVGLIIVSNKKKLEAYLHDLLKVASMASTKITQTWINGYLLHFL
uniref:Uncharacterized protein n=1 Tax=Utricularia reniformis TaxID=192314 RepID=A0A1Y0B2S6_9LAMI|nr:hypothetical protein AEK19_MT1509 [Utricularia reniformis]ART31700.1 hypothetical protein AEK19_MT1509 [Utricularia reniformis]